MKRYSLLSFGIICLSFSSFAQSKKDVKANRLKSTTEYTTETINGKEVNYKSTYWAYDKEGNTIEKNEYLPEGGLKKKYAYKLDSKGNKIEEIDFSLKSDKPDETKNTKIVSKFNSDNDKTEEIVYDGTSGKQIKKTQVSYNSNGNKSIEVVFDAENKLLKKSVYTYDKKGLKIEKKTYDSLNQLVETKKFVHQS